MGTESQETCRPQSVVTPSRERLAVHYYHHLRSSRSFLFAAVVLYICLSGTAYAQSSLKIYGQVINNFGVESNIRVSIADTPYETTTDGNGFYRFYDIPPGKYQLICYRGVTKLSKTGIIDLGDGPVLRQDIYLDSGIFNVQAVEIEADAPDMIGFAGESARVYHVNQGAVESIEDIIERVPGLNLVKSTATGEAYITAGGSRSEGINVLVDGIKINSLLSGRADINQLPLKAISKIEYYSTGAGKYASDGGIGGTVNFVTTTNNRSELLDLDISHGSYGDEDYAGGIGYESESLGNIRALAEFGYSRNDYKYTHYFYGEQVRENAYARYDKYYLAYSNSISGNDLSFTGFIYESSNGVPGRINTPSSEAISGKSSSTLGVKLNRLISKSFKLELSSSFSERNSDYEDYGSWIPYDNSYYERESALKLNAEEYIWNGFSAVQTISFTNSHLDGNDFIRQTSPLDNLYRDVYKIHTGLNYHQSLKQLDFNAGVSFSHIGVNGKSYQSGSASGTLTLNLPVKVGVTSSYSRSLRLPGLAELYWKGDVFLDPNQNLSPERSRSISTELFSGFIFAGKWRLSSEYKDIRYTNLIYWIRSRGNIYRPENFSKSDYFGLILAVNYKTPGDYLEVDFSRERAHPVYKVQGMPFYNKYVTFQPLYSNHLAMTLNYARVSLQAEMQDISERYYNEDNTKSLAPYTLLNIGLRYEIVFGKLIAAWLFEINNVTDTEYDHLEYQPGAPRSYHLGVNFKM